MQIALGFWRTQLLVNWNTNVDYYSKQEPADGFISMFPTSRSYSELEQ